MFSKNITPKTNLTRHIGRVDQLLYAPKAQRLISISADQTIRIIDTVSFELVAILHPLIGLEKEGILMTGALSHDETLLAIGGNIGTDKSEIIVLNWQEHKIVTQIKGHIGGVRGLAFSPDDQWFVSGGRDNLVKVWDTKNWQPTATLEGHRGGIEAIAYAPSGHFFASGSLDSSINIWKQIENKWQLHQSLKGHSGPVFSLAFAPQGNLLVSGGQEANLIFWEINKNWQPIVVQRETQAIGAISFSKAGRFLAFKEEQIKMNFWKATPKSEFRLQVFDFIEQQFIATLTDHTNTILSSCFIEEDKIASAAGNGTVIIQNIYDGKIHYQSPNDSQPITAVGLATNELESGFGHSMIGRRPYPLTHSFNWSELTFQKGLSRNKAYSQNQARSFKNVSISQLTAHHLQISNGHKILLEDLKDGKLQDFGFTANGNIIIAADFTIKKYDIQGNFLGEYIGYTGEIRGFSLTQDGQYLVSAGTDHQLKLWNSSTRELLASLYVQNDEEWVCWSPEGFYETSPKGKDLISFFEKITSDQVPFLVTHEKYYQYYHRPNSLKQIIASGSASKIVQSQPAKALSIEISSATAITSTKNYSFRGIIESDSPLTRVQLFHNQQPINLTSDFSATVPRFIVQETVNLKIGVNQFELTVENQAGQQKVKACKIPYQPKPELVLSTGHATAVKVMAFSPNNKLLATGSLDNVIKIWEIPTQRLKFSIQANINNAGGGIGIYTLHFSKDSSTLLSTNGSQQITLYDTETGHLKQTLHDGLKIDYYLNDLLFTKEEKYILTGDTEGHMKLWSIATRKVVHKLTNSTNEIKKIALHPNNETLYTLDSNGQITFWDLISNNVIKTIALDLPTTKNSFNNFFLKISQDGQYLVAGSSQAKCLHIFQMDNGKQIQLIHFDAVTALMDIAFVANEHQLLIGGLEVPIKVWDISTGNYHKNIGAVSKQFQSLAISSDGKYVASAEGILRLAGINIHHLTGQKETYKLGHVVSAINAIKYIPNSSMIIFGGIDALLYGWDFELGQKIAIEQVHENCYLAARGINVIATSQDGKLMATAGCDKKVFLWKIQAKQFSKTQELPHQEDINDLTFTSDGKFLASASVDRTIKIWEAATGTCIATLTGYQRGISAIVFSPDNQLLAGGNFDEIKLWDWKNQVVVKQVETGFQSMFPLPTSSLQKTAFVLKEYSFTEKISLVFAPDGHSILIAGEAFNQGTIYEWAFNANNWSLYCKIAFNFAQKITSLSFDPSNQYLLAGTNNPFNISVLDVNTRAVLHTLVGHQENVADLAFSPSGKQLFSVSHDGSLKIWDWQTPQLVGSLNTHDGKNFTWSTPEGYFYSNKSNAKELAFKLDNQLIPFEQFDLLLNRPDIILERFGYAQKEQVIAYRNAYLKRLQKMNIKAEDLKLDFANIPIVQIQRPDLKDFVKAASYSFNCVVNGRNTPITKIHVYVNDVPIYGRKGLDYTTKQQVEIQERINIELSNGKNKIQVSAHNESGIESLKATFHLTYEGVPKKSNLHIIAIGVDEYDHLQNLNFPEKDATDIIKLFQHSPLNYHQTKAYPLLGNQLSLSKLSQLKTDLKQTNVDDVVILFYSGHGFLDTKGNLFLSTKIANVDNPNQTAIPYESVENLLDGIPARQKLVFIDACHSGEIDQENKQLRISSQEAIKETTKGMGVRRSNFSNSNGFELMKELFVDLRRGTGATIISAAQGVELAQESVRWNNGVFTYAILNGLQEKKANLNKDGTITISDLQKYVAELVATLTNGLQQPTSRLENISNDFRIW